MARPFASFVIAALLSRSPASSRPIISAHDSSPGPFRKALACSVDPRGFVYVIDGGASTLAKLSQDGEVLETVGGYGWTDQAFDHPADLIAPNGLDVYVADYGNHRIQRLDRNLNFISSYSTRDDETAEVHFGYPRGVAQSRFGLIFITDGENKRILKVNSNGTVESVFGDIGAGEGRLESPSRIRVGSDDRVYVQDANRIVVFDIFGNFVETLGSGFFTHLRSFTVEDRTVYVLDSCAMYAFQAGGSVERLRVFTSHGAGTDPCDAVDFDVNQNRVYILTEHRLTIGKLDLEPLGQQDTVR